MAPRTRPWSSPPARALLSAASATAQCTGRPLAEVLAEADELSGVLDATALAELCDPAGYTGAAGELVDRALRD